MNTAVSRMYVNLPIESNMKTDILKLQADIENISKKTLADVPALPNILREKPFYVYKGGPYPILNSSIDILSARFPMIVECTQFFSTSCDYAVAHRFVSMPGSASAKLIWKLRVQTSLFACLGKFSDGLGHIEKEFLFGYGQRIDIQSVSINEDGHPVINGILLDYAVPTTYMSGGRRQALPIQVPAVLKNALNYNEQPPGKEKVNVIENDGICDFFTINEERDGSPEKPYLLATDGAHSEVESKFFED